ncbi:hypothetical protein EYD45_16230 [Hyunsoonleella flava]|uniref:Nuclear transport factor 2 family protein n=1 Tax=Hyunsoonleella flava TaxID=2527939 RepID=A0A4Q9FCX8_9FLAO|nr:hypothetical protein [Hyunsoonleella flava]TBM98497.1 hypothetical protein EYD45_16230 [Hyunsoonleella flava]
MNKLTVFLLLITIGTTSCKNSEKELDKLEIAKKFYVAINNSNPSETTELITEIFTTIDDGFEQKYSGNEYAEWVKWDSVFQPTYEILEIGQENGTVKAKISKIDKRISFLHHEPIITNEIIQFEGNRIKNINRTSASFNVDKFVKNRDELVNWITENQPELNGFLNDQTKSGGMNYLKAIELYRNKK